MYDCKQELSAANYLMPSKMSETFTSKGPKRYSWSVKPGHVKPRNEVLIKGPFYFHHVGNKKCFVKQFLNSV